MTDLEKRPRPVELHPVDAAPGSALWAWVSVALVPVGFLLALLAAVVFDASGQEGGSIGAGALALMALGVPALAVLLSVRAARAGHASGRAAVVVSVVLLVGMLVLLPLVVVSVPVAVAAAAVCLVALGIGLWWERRVDHL
jgi:hypothetical protein